jgi:molybdenum cofactor cytidylyltransferase
MLGKETKIRFLILAAGASRRLGQPKQLVKFKGESLVYRISKEALKSQVGNVTVVTGYKNEEISAEIEGLDVNTYFNSEWKEGMGSSIRNGLSAILQEDPETNAVIIAMVDQPYVSAAHFEKLFNAYDSSRPMIIASAYGGTFGVPVLVDNFYFEMLKGLKGDEGGKKIFVNYLKNIVEIPFAEGSIDIDEEEDLLSLQ